MTIYNETHEHMNQPLFLGDSLGIARYETVQHQEFENLTEKQLSFFWRPEEINLTRDKIEYDNLSIAEKFVFDENLAYQSLLDTVQGRAPSLAFLPIVSDLGYENWIITWTFSETIHSRSYTHILRNVYNNPSTLFDSIGVNKAIQKRARAITKHYDELIHESRDLAAMKNRVNAGLMSETHPAFVAQRTLVLELIYIVMHVVNALEAIRFYVSFSCTFSFNENGKMEGTTKIMKLIARDEQLHLRGTQYVIKYWQSGKESEMYEIAKRLEHVVTSIFEEVYLQEKEWATHLMSKGEISGISEKSLHQYIYFLAYHRSRAVGLKYGVETPHNPFQWMSKYLSSDSTQTAAQEVEASSYLVSQVNSDITPEFLKTLKV